MKEIKFQWDEKKRISNIQKHKIDFVDVVNIFYDDETIIIEDQNHYEEHRYIALGMDSKLRVVVVVHVYHDMDSIRIVSARKADPQEREQLKR